MRKMKNWFSALMTTKALEPELNTSPTPTHATYGGEGEEKERKRERRREERGGGGGREEKKRGE